GLSLPRRRFSLPHQRPNRPRPWQSPRVLAQDPRRRRARGRRSAWVDGAIGPAGIAVLVTRASPPGEKFTRNLRIGLLGTSCALTSLHDSNRRMLFAGAAQRHIWAAGETHGAICN